MIGKMIGAGLGAALSKQTRKIDGPMGAVLGTIAVPVLSRLSLPAMAAIGVGGYLWNKLANKAQEPAMATPRANV